MITGFYYLHVDGSLIFKHNLPGTAADIRESDFAVMLWPLEVEDRENAWQILIEALACGAKPERIQDLAAKWHCDDSDAQTYADRAGVLLSMDGDQWCATQMGFVNLMESPAGFGDTALEAMAELCKELGYRPQKTWGASFADFLK